MGFVHAFDGRLQVRPRVHSRLPELVAGYELVVEIVRSGHIELFNRRPVVQQRKQVDLCVFQALLGSLQVRFILHPLQFQSVEIDLRNVTGIKASSTDIKHVVVVHEIVFCELEHRFRLQR